MISVAAVDGSFRTLETTSSARRWRTLFSLDPFFALGDFIVIMDPIPFFDLAAATGAVVVVGAEDGAADGAWVGGLTGGPATVVGFNLDADLEPCLLPPLR